jgi:beta-phosphoglucomutase-like phosphatase (HAD superfamily)
MSIEALIFDVDGTLADTEEAHRTAFNLAFERCGLGWNWSREHYRDLLKITGGKERISHYIQSLPINDAEHRRLQDRIPVIHVEKTKIYSSVVMDGGVPLRTGIARLLDEAEDAGYRLAIASTTTAVNIDALLNATLGSRGLERFSVIACGDQVLVKKPAPDIYQLALHHLGLPASSAIAFEDSPNGVRAALAAGLWTVVTPTFWTEGGDFSSANLLLPSLGDLTQPLKGEPGIKLKQHAWLSIGELIEKASPRKPARREWDAPRH